MKLTYFGHSAYQIETNGTTLLFDPFITGNPHAEGVVTAADLNPDVILLTHAHGDHWGDTMSIARRTNALIVANFEMTQYISKTEGYSNVHPMNVGGAWKFDWGNIKQTYARHSSSFPDGTYGGSPNGYLSKIEGKCIYNVGDTAPTCEMGRVGEDYDIDLALIPIGDCFTMGLEESVRAVKMLRPSLTIPLHYNTFPLIKIDIEEWVEMMHKANFAPKVLDPGETLEV